MSDEESGTESPTNECPVCYERLQTLCMSERRLSCGHSFCHDCLVKYLMTSKKEGSMKKNIICPLCRYVTFLSKRGLILPPKVGELNQILEVPLTPPCPRHAADAGSLNTLVIPISETVGMGSQQGLPTCTCLGDSSAEVTNHSHGSQVFIISDQGQPMESEEVTTRADTQPPDTRVNCCRSPSLMMLILMIFLVAVIAAVLPWILFVRKT
ncbi:hypothetical protein FKM82_007865 [Ascaphus truei]